MCSGRGTGRGTGRSTGRGTGRSTGRGSLLDNWNIFIKGDLFNF